VNIFVHLIQELVVEKSLVIGQRLEVILVNLVQRANLFRGFAALSSFALVAVGLFKLASFGFITSSSIFLDGVCGGRAWAFPRSLVVRVIEVAISIEEVLVLLLKESVELMWRIPVVFLEHCKPIWVFEAAHVVIFI